MYYNLRTPSRNYRYCRVCVRTAGIIIIIVIIIIIIITRPRKYYIVEFRTDNAHIIRNTYSYINNIISRGAEYSGRELIIIELAPAELDSSSITAAAAPQTNTRTRRREFYF